MCFNIMNGIGVKMGLYWWSWMMVELGNSREGRYFQHDCRTAAECICNLTRARVHTCMQDVCQMCLYYSAFLHNLLYQSQSHRQRYTSPKGVTTISSRVLFDTELKTFNGGHTAQFGLKGTFIRHYLSYKSPI